METLDAVVDTEFMHCWVPASILARLGVGPLERRALQTPDGRLVEREMGEAVVSVDGKARVTLVGFGDEGTESILGWHALHGFGLEVDPVHRRLVPLVARCRIVWR